MTVVEHEPFEGDADLSELQIGNLAERSGAPIADIEDAPEEEPEEERLPVGLLSASVTSLLATAAVGWMLGGIFAGSAPRLFGVAGALVGAGVVAASSRMRRPTTLQLLALPIGAVLGFGLTAIAAEGVSVPVLVVDAITAGGLSQPPVPFDPGWRFLLFVLTCGIAVTAATGAVALNRARVAAFLPAPVMIAGVLVQPDGEEVLSVVPALVLLVAALAVSYGGELSRETGTGSSFEIRRLGKAGAFLMVIVALMVGMSQLGFLFPPPEDSSVIPPKRPETPPPLTTNKVLYSIDAKKPVPLRLGVLDSYDGIAWLTPPYDPKRYTNVGGSNLPTFTPDRLERVVAQSRPAKSVQVGIRIVEPGAAREIPTVSNTFAVRGAPDGTQFDPRAQTLRLPGRGSPGTTYTVEAAVPASAKVLAKAKAPGSAVRQFVQAPKPPPAVRELLGKLPPNLNLYERLQGARTAFYKKVTASGPGNPVGLAPSRVDEFLNGTPATPYEITSSEVLLARWAGVPARIGYGYYDEDAKAGKDDRINVREADGAMWLEAYFDGAGWTPILGKPPKAQASLDDKQQKNQRMLPAGTIVAQLYIPVRQESLLMLYTLVQFWLVRVAAVAGVVVFFWILLPGLLKQARRVRRRRWAGRLGPRARIAVAYAELRDRAIDFNIGHPTLTPLQFLDALEPDDDHTQLAWAVTRGLWGDLARDLREEDVEGIEQWSRQLRRRLNAAQPYLMRTLAFGSRVSLRDPWSREMPNLYYRRGPVALALGGLRALLRAAAGVAGRLQWRRMLPALSRASVILIALITLSGCVQRVDMSTAAASAPLPSVPAKLDQFAFKRTKLGDPQFEAIRDVAIISDYRLYVIRKSRVAVGTLQTATFKPGLRSRNRQVREGVLTTLGGDPKAIKVGGEIFYAVTINQLRLLVWFARDGQTYHMLAASKDIDKPEELFARIVAKGQGKSDKDITVEQGAPPADVRRGRF